MPYIFRKANGLSSSGRTSQYSFASFPYDQFNFLPGINDKNQLAKGLFLKKAVKEHKNCFCPNGSQCRQKRNTQNESPNSCVKSPVSNSGGDTGGFCPPSLACVELWRMHSQNHSRPVSALLRRGKIADRGDIGFPERRMSEMSCGESTA